MNRSQRDIAVRAVHRDDRLVERAGRHVIKSGLHQRQRDSATDNGAPGVLARTPDRVGQNGVQTCDPEPLDGGKGDLEQ
ncbi:MAG: hypothetical protein ACYDC9_02890 [Dermatophilaceae bacterium]